MSKQFQMFTILVPQPLLLAIGIPQRVSLVDRFVRTVIIEAPDTNKGDMFISDTEANAALTNRHTLVKGSLLTFGGDKYGNLDAQFNLRDLWFNGTRANDLLVVSFFPIDVKIC